MRNFTAYSYVRLSSKRQAEGNKTGTERQLAKPAEICRQNGWKLSTKTFSDLGVSAYRGDNLLKGDLANFITLAKQKKLGENPLLIIEQFDRFSRQDIDESEPAILNLLKNDVALFVAFTNKLFTKESTKDIASRIEILLSLKQAFDYSSNLSKRVSGAMDIIRKRIEKGEVFKHCNTPKFYTWDDSTNQYVRNEHSKTVNRIINEFLSGKTKYAIIKDLNREAIATLSGKGKWTVMSMKHLMVNHALYGSFYGNDNFFGNPIIDKNTFDKIQVLFNQTKNLRGRFNKEHVNIFRGIAKCPYCESSFSLYVDSRGGKRKKPIRYFRCSGISNANGCKNTKSFNLDEFEFNVFLNVFKKSPSFFTKKADVSVDDDITKIQSELIKVSGQIDKLLMLDIELDELQNRLSTLKKTKEDLSNQLMELNLKRNTNTSDSLSTVKKVIPETRQEVSSELDTYHHYMRRLEDNEIRKRLQLVMPTLIKKIELDGINNRCKVISIDGKEITL
jgi:DNA invertase Pin-like site-specific DNA recombinase